MLIKLRDYERIFQIISGVIDSEKGDRAYSCIYYSLFAASILTDHFKLKPKVRCGLALYHLGDEDQVLCFGVKSDEGVAASEEGFHCWIEVEDWLLDFMAPTFGDLNKTSFTSRQRMFQKRTSDMKDHPNEMTEAGDFHLLHDQELAEMVLMPVCERLAVQDLASLCSQWFKKTPRKIPMSAATRDQNGKTRPISLKPVSLKPSW